MITSHESVFEIESYLSQDLATRHSASDFLEIVERTDANSVVISFHNVQSITRSFADEYQKRKRKSRLVIVESDVPSNVQKMFDIVGSPNAKSSIVDFHKLKIGLL